MLVFQPSREEGEGGMGGAQVGWDKIPSLHEKNSDGSPNLLNI